MHLLHAASETDRRRTDEAEPVGESPWHTEVERRLRIRAVRGNVIDVSDVPIIMFTVRVDETD